MPDSHDDSSREKTEWSQYWQILCRKRWWLALPAFCIWIVVWATAWFLPAVYRSETLILVEQQQVPEQYIVSNVATNLQDRLQSMTQQILSRTRLLRIMENFSLYPKLRPWVTEDELVERMRRDIQVELVQSPNRRGDLTAFKVAYLSYDPQLAQKVTSELTSLFINENVRSRQEKSEQTTQFLAGQLDAARGHLAAQEAKVKDFKSQHLGQLPEQVQSNLQILAGLQTQLQQETDLFGKAKQQSVYLATLLSQWQSLERMLTTGKGTSGETQPALEQELTRLRAELTDLRSRYTERHPDIRKLKNQIAKIEKLKQQMELQITAAAQSGPPESISRPASYADLQATSSRMEVESQIKANEVEILNRERAIQDLQRRIEEYQGRLNMTPVREQQLAGLTRDYEQSRKNYEQLLTKRDQSEMATDLERRQKGEQFVVLDPPNLPQKPYSPNRLKLDLAGVIAGLLVGSAFMIGSHVVDDTVYSVEECARLVPAPVLTEIPPLPTATEVRRAAHRKWIDRVALSLMILVVSGGSAASYLFG